LFKSYPIVRCLGLLGLALLVSPVEAQWGGLSERSLAQCVPADELMIRGQVDREFAAQRPSDCQQSRGGHAR
jgi:hypothetical protein